MELDNEELDHCSVSIWRCGVGWMVSYSCRGESGDLLRHGGVTVPATRRPTTGVDPLTAALRVLVEAFD